MSKKSFTANPGTGKGGGNGKGDRNRVSDKRAYRRNFDAIKWNAKSKGKKS